MKEENALEITADKVTLISKESHNGKRDQKMVNLSLGGEMPHDEYEIHIYVKIYRNISKSYCQNLRIVLVLGLETSCFISSLTASEVKRLLGEKHLQSA